MIGKVPNKAELDALIDQLGGKEIAGRAMQEALANIKRDAPQVTIVSTGKNEAAS